MQKLEHGKYLYEDQTGDCPNRFKTMLVHVGGDNEGPFIRRPDPGICSVCGFEPRLISVNGKPR